MPKEAITLDRAVREQAAHDCEMEIEKIFSDFKSKIRHVAGVHSTVGLSYWPSLHLVCREADQKQIQMIMMDEVLRLIQDEVFQAARPLAEDQAICRLADLAKTSLVNIIDVSKLDSL